jgi:hypothetical protein
VVATGVDGAGALGAVVEGAAAGAATGVPVAGTGVGVGVEVVSGTGVGVGTVSVTGAGVATGSGTGVGVGVGVSGTGVGVGVVVGVVTGPVNSSKMPAQIRQMRCEARHGRANIMQMTAATCASAAVPALLPRWRQAAGADTHVHPRPSALASLTLSAGAMCERQQAQQSHRQAAAALPPLPAHGGLPPHASLQRRPRQ